MALVAGSYEKFIWGFSFKPSQPQALTLKTLFSYASHIAPIKCVAAAGPIAASGGADDAIKLYDIASAADLGSLLDHRAAVTALAFFNPSLPSLPPRNLVSSSDDGDVCIYDADPFVHLTTIRAHRKGVTDLALHPSGRAALTVGRDSCLALLNLIRGRRSFSCRLDREASIVKYGLGGGERFFVVADERITVHDSEDARLIHEMNAGKRVLCIAPAAENGLIFAGGEDCCITAWDTRSGKVAYQFEEAHPTRIKGLVVFKTRNEAQNSEASSYIASASADGVIRVWDTRMVSQEEITPLGQAITKSRLTCLAASSTK